MELRFDIRTFKSTKVDVQNGGVDFVFIDTEHIPIDRSQLSWMCRTYSGMGITPVCRVPEPEPFRVCSYIDGGAKGKIFFLGFIE